MSLFSLKGKVIVITGASGLLGKEHIAAIANQGGIPVLIDLNQEELNRQVLELRKRFSTEFFGLSVDITNEEKVKRSCLEIVNKYGKIDGLINNASNNPKVENSKSKSFSRIENFSMEDWKKDLDVGLKGSFLCIKYFGFEISKNPLGGSIINISSDLGLIAPDQSLYKIDGLSDNHQPVKPVTYSVVKSGIIGLTRYVSTYWADKGVRCNALCPGGVENKQDVNFINKLKTKVPMNRMAKKNEYRGSIIYLLSDASSYVNGAIIVADGGRTVW
tara:strand:+ start:286 stop:1107 length:822 start_codon:yes stop_codon:yes gene_type:complete